MITGVACAAFARDKKDEDEKAKEERIAKFNALKIVAIVFAVLCVIVAITTRYVYVRLERIRTQ